MLNRIVLTVGLKRVFSEKICETILEIEQHIIEFAVELHRKPFSHISYSGAWQIANAVAHAYFDDENAVDYLEDVQSMYDKRFEEFDT